MTLLAFQLSNEASLFWILVTILAIIAICFVAMAISLIFVALQVRRVVGIAGQLQQKAEPLIQSANNLGVQAKEIAEKGKEIVEKFTQLSDHLNTATRHLSDSAGLIKDELAEIKIIVGQTAETAKEKVALVSQTIDRTNGQVLDTANFIQSKVIEPAREFAAIMVGVRRGLEVLFAPAPKQINSAYNNDEMFIG